MKITREIIDNDKKIIHINYEDKDIKEAIKKMEEENQKKNNLTQLPNV